MNLRSLGVRNYPLYLVGQLASLRGVDAVGGDRPAAARPGGDTRRGCSESQGGRAGNRCSSAETVCAPMCIGSAIAWIQMPSGGPMARRSTS